MNFGYRNYSVSLWLAFPALLWPAVEMYLWTLQEPQMLFFSVTHTAPVLVVLVLVSIPFFLAVLVMSAAATFSLRARSSIGLTRATASVTTLALLFHSIALATYESWSLNAPLRISMCLVGLVCVSWVIRFAITRPKTPNPSINTDAAR